MKTCNPWKTFIGAAVLLLSPAMWAQSHRTTWKIIRNSDICQYAVPSDWKQDNKHRGMATSPDEKVAVVPQNIHADESFDDVKKQLQDKMPPLKILQDDVNRYWYVYRDPADAEDSPDTHWYVAVQRNDHVCALQITFKSADGESLPKQIAATIVPGK